MARQLVGACGESKHSLPEVLRSVGLDEIFGWLRWLSVQRKNRFGVGRVRLNAVVVEEFTLARIIGGLTPGRQLEASLIEGRFRVGLRSAIRPIRGAAEHPLAMVERIGLRAGIGRVKRGEGTPSTGGQEHPGASIDLGMDNAV